MADSVKPKPWKDYSKDYNKKFFLFLKLEWATENLVFQLSRWAFIDLLKILGNFTILFAVITYLTSSDQRKQQALDQRKAKHYQAWQEINSAQGKTGNGGRSDALEDLVKDGVVLDGINVKECSISHSNLRNIQCASGSFAHSLLSWVNFRNSLLYQTDFSISNLDYCCFLFSFLQGLNLENSSLRGSDFKYASIISCNLNGSDLYKADLENTYIYDVSFRPNCQSIGGPTFPNEFQFISTPRVYKNRVSFANTNWIVKQRATAAPYKYSDLKEQYLVFQEDKERILERWDTTSYMAIEPVDLTSGDLKNASIHYSGFAHAILDSTNLEDAIIEHCDLRGVSLIGVKNWKKIKSLKNSFLIGSEAVPQGFMDFAIEKGAIIAYILEGDTLKSNPNLVRAWRSEYNASLMKTPLRHIPDDGIEDNCLMEDKSFINGGRYISTNDLLINPMKYQQENLHFWDIKSNITTVDSVRHKIRLKQFYIVENTSDSFITASISNWVGTFKYCIYSGEIPNETFVPEVEKVVSLLLEPKALKLILFDFGDFNNASDKVCRGFSQLYPTIVKYSAVKGLNKDAVAKGKEQEQVLDLIIKD